MMMQEPDPTPFDLSWRMFGVRVRVHPLFWVLAAFIGWGNYLQFGLPYLFIWIGCVFVSILLHEFGHVIVGRLFGAEGRILLYCFGGLAIGSSDLRRSWQRVAVYLAGPGVQLVLAGGIRLLMYLYLRRLGDWDPRAIMALIFLFEINFYWAVFNLLPVYPLDGGQVTREVCEGIAPGRGAVLALGTSTVVCCAIALLILLAANKKIEIRGIQPTMYNALLFGMFAANSYQALQAERSRHRWDDRLPWER